MSALKKWSLYSFLTVFMSAVVTISSHSQNTSDLGFRAMVDKTRIVIGEAFTLTFVIRSTAGYPVPSAPASPGVGHHLELLESFPPDTLRTEDVLQISHRYRMTSFDSGHWVIPSFEVFITGSNKVLISDTIGIDVSMLPLTGNDYHDIKDIIDIKPESSPWIRYLIYFSLFLLAAVIVGFIIHLKRKKRGSPPSETGSDAFSKAMHDIDLLLRDLERRDKDSEQVHLALHEIFRTYLEKSFGMPAMSASTTDLLIMLKDLVNGSVVAEYLPKQKIQPDGMAVDVISDVRNTPKVKDLSSVKGLSSKNDLSPVKNLSAVKDLSTVAETLRMSDAVKFARYQPGKEDTLRSIDRVRSFIVQLHEKR